jgi:hypothetical protein
MQNAPVFDGAELIRALDEKRAGHELDWNELAHELWDQSEALNAELGGNALCSGALVRTAHRTTMSCQYALIILRWLGRPPEDFLVGQIVDVGDTRLPQAGPDRRLRWNLPEVHAALNERRNDHQLTWTALAEQLGCTPNRLTNLRTARLADMDLAMRVTQWIRAPAAAFIHPERW